MERFEPVQEMRRFPRYPIDMRVKISFKKDGILQRANVRTIEIATHGIAIISPLPLPQDSQVELEITLPETRTPIRVTAMIRNKCGTRYGVEFLSTTDSQKYDITKYGTSRKPVSADAPQLSSLPAAN
jgi:hypothetical protein